MGLYRLSSSCRQRQARGFEPPKRPLTEFVMSMVPCPSRFRGFAMKHAQRCSCRGALHAAQLRPGSPPDTATMPSSPTRPARRAQHHANPHPLTACTRLDRKKSRVSLNVRCKLSASRDAEMISRNCAMIVESRWALGFFDCASASDHFPASRAIIEIRRRIKRTDSRSSRRRERYRCLVVDISGDDGG